MCKANRADYKKIYSRCPIILIGQIHLFLINNRYCPINMCKELIKKRVIDTIVSFNRGMSQRKSQLYK